MTMLDRFLAGDVSVRCYTRMEAEEFISLLREDGRVFEIYKDNDGIMDAILRHRDLRVYGVEIAIKSRQSYETGELIPDCIAYNPISDPLENYPHFTFTETVDFSDFQRRNQPVHFNQSDFMKMIGVDAGGC